MRQGARPPGGRGSRSRRPAAPQPPVEGSASKRRTEPRRRRERLSEWNSFHALLKPSAAEAAALPADEIEANAEAQGDELTAVQAIYENELRVVRRGASGADGEARPTCIELRLSLEAPSSPAATVDVPPPLRAAAAAASAAAFSAAEADAASASTVADGSVIRLEELPPLSLRLRLPVAYPSRSAPVFGLRCAWLSDAQLGLLATELDAIWADAVGGPVLCEWIEWLRGSAVGVLPAETLHPLALPPPPARPAKAPAVADAPSGQTLICPPCSGTPAACADSDRAAAPASTAAAPTAAAAAVSSKGLPPPLMSSDAAALSSRAARWPRGQSEVLSSLLAHMQSAAAQRWREQLHTCGICLEDSASCDCARFVRCGHTFCRACVSAYFVSQMGSGLSTALECPEPSCRVAATPPEVKALLPPEAFERYEAQQLQTTLATMRDVTWCPRCEYPAILLDGDGGRLALCGKCSYSFCCECRAGWHGLSPCANLATRWRDADEAGRAALRAKHGERVMEEVASSEWVLNHTKPCPRCSVATQKAGGCNHITCRKCNHEWCWLCSKAYGPNHYSTGSCEQFSQDFFDEIRAAEIEAEEGALADAFEAFPNWEPEWEPQPDWITGEW